MEIVLRDLVRGSIPARNSAAYSDAKIDAALWNAACIVLNTLRPIRNGLDTTDYTDPKIPGRYMSTQVAIAIEILAKEGAQGESSHREQGLSRVYTSGDISTRVMTHITPIAESGG